MERNAMAYYNILSDARDALRTEIEANDVRDYEDAFEYIHEIADRHVPIYYTDIFTVMAADGIDLEFDDSGLIPDTRDVTRILQARIYEQLVIDLYGDVEDFVQEYVDSIEDEDEDDEE